MALQQFIRSLQHRPYEQRVRFLWVGSIISACILILVWVGLSKLSARGGSWTDNKLFHAISQQLNLAKEKFPNLTATKNPATPEAAAGLPENFQVVQIRSFSQNKIQHQLVINFIASNPTEDIMTFLNAGRSNIYLQDGEARLQPTSIKAGDLPYPSKILSQTSYPGQAVFPLPEDPQVTLIIEGMIMQDHPDILFSPPRIFSAPLSPF